MSVNKTVASPRFIADSGRSAPMKRRIASAIASIPSTVYGHIFDADLDLVAENLDGLWSAGERGERREVRFSTAEAEGIL